MFERIHVRPRVRFALSAFLPVVLGAALVASFRPVQDSRNSLMFVADSEGELETQIGAYLERAHGLQVNYLTLKTDDSDTYLKLVFDAAPAPDFQVYVDTSRTSKTPAGKAASREVKVWSILTLGVKPGDARRTPLLELMNTYLVDYRMPHRVYLDKDGDMILESRVDIPKRDTPVPTEWVYDTISMTSTAWKKLHELLAEKGLKPK